MDPNTSIFEDEAQLANFGMENRSSSESSPGFNFSLNPRKNLKESFDKEVARLSNDHVVTQSGAIAACNALSYVSIPTKEKAVLRPPLHRNHSSRRNLEHNNGSVTSSSHRKVAVYLRIRPPSLPVRTIHGANDDRAANNTIEILDPTSEPGRFPTRIRTYPPALSNSYRVNINRQSRDASAYAKEFNFDCIMGPETSQRTVYSAVAAPMLQDLLQSMCSSQSSQVPPQRYPTNKSALLFSYGITNAGKTHTVLGDLNSKNQSNWGIIPRAISEIFDHNHLRGAAPSSGGRHPPKQSSEELSPLQLYVSFFEIYNEQVYDLMPSKKTMSKYPLGQAPPLKVRECRGETLVRGLAKHKVENTQHGIELTKIAQAKRHTSSNNINSDSSRSHFVCQMQIVPTSDATSGSLDVDDDASTVTSMTGYSTDDELSMNSRLKTSTVWIVDLAGSERSKRTQVGSMRQKESTQINMSLMTLMRCLNAIQDNGRHGSSIVPFRESKLTHIFMSHLTSVSAARTAIMVNVNPAIDDFDETQHVLAYATKAKLIEMDPEEYGRKRKQHFGEEYDLNGRKKVKPIPSKSNHAERSPAKKKGTLFSRMAKKLSPKRVFQKASAVANPLAKELESTARDTEVEALKLSLQEAQSRIESLEYDNSQLQDELVIKEDQIRSEVAVEMEERLRETRRKHQEKYQQLQLQMGQESSKTAFSVKMGRAESQLEELMDKIDECEKEMIRLGQNHKQEVESLEGQITMLQRQLETAISAKQAGDARIETLERELEQYKTKHSKREKQRTPKTKNSKTEENNLDVQDVENAPVDDEDQFSTEPLKFTLSVTKKAYRKKLRPRKPALRNATNMAV